MILLNNCFNLSCHYLDNDDTDVEDSPRYAPPPRTKTLPERPALRKRSRPTHKDDKSTLAISNKPETKRSGKKAAPETMKEFMNKKHLKSYRYEATGFNAMKENLVKDSDFLNKNTSLNKMTSKDNKEKEPQTQNETEKEKTVSSAERDMKTPPPSPTRNENVTVTKVTTVTRKTILNHINNDPETVSVSTVKGNEVTKHLDEAETQMGIDTAREQKQTKPNEHRRGSVVSNLNGPNANNRTTQRAPSLQSVRESKPQTKELPPVRPPSRSSIVSKDVKTTVPLVRKPSNASVIHQNGQQKNETKQNGHVATENERKGSILPADIVKPTHAQQNGHHTSPDQPSTPASQGQRKPVGRRNSTASIQSMQVKKPSTILGSNNSSNNSLTSVRENNERAGNGVSTEQPKSIDTRTEHKNRSMSLVQENTRPENKQNKVVNGHDTNTENKAPKTKVTTSVSVKENVVTRETTNGVPSKGIATKRKVVLKPAKKTSPGKGKGQTQLKDTKMTSEEYERNSKGRSRERSSSGKGTPRRGRSTSGGRRKGRKRSRSGERKKASPKARFPDIQKQNGKWEITARTTDEKEEENDIIIEPSKNTTENQWKSLVEKYIRQPSPTIRKADDRSLLGSINDDDDDDDIDIFKRATRRYGLDNDDDDDSDSQA